MDGDRRTTMLAMICSGGSRSCRVAHDKHTRSRQKDKGEWQPGRHRRACLMVVLLPLHGVVASSKIVRVVRVVPKACVLCFEGGVVLELNTPKANDFLLL